VSAITARRYSRGLARRSPDSYDPADHLARQGGRDALVHRRASPLRDFGRRADRPEFWWFALINLIISLVIWAVGIAVFGYAVGELLAIVYGLATCCLPWASRSAAWWIPPPHRPLADLV